MTQIVLESEVRDEIVGITEKLKGEGRLLSERQLQTHLETFRTKFGPRQLERLGGTELLEQMHNQSTRDSLAYWLEFKNDDEFPTPRFGSIAGGSALKFSVWFRKESGTWMGRSSSNVPAEISERDAVSLALKHRDQLLAGVELLHALPAGATDEDYDRLQTGMDAKAPDVSDLAWGHKYFSLLFADKLDDFHNADLQRFHLIKLLQTPSEKRGRYVFAGWFVRLAAQVDLHPNQFTAVVNARHGRLHRYWRVGTSEGDNDPIHWPAMRDGGYAAVGWPKLGDLSDVVGSQNLRNQLIERLAINHPNTPQATGRSASEIFRFVREADEGDIVVAANGSEILGVGKIAPGSHYVYQGSDGFPHQRAVTWLDIQAFTLPQPSEGLQSTFRELRNAVNLVAIERRILGSSPRTAPRSASQPARGAVPPLSGVAGRVQAILERKGQVILHGPPGTGKTYWAERTAYDLAAQRAFGQPYSSLNPDQRSTFEREGYVRLCTFHPSYGYEDFLEGYRPYVSEEGKLVYRLEDGIFKRLCQSAAHEPRSDYFLIIDEINRGDIPRIFGELLTIIEKSKRGRPVRLAVSGGEFHVPSNVYLIGTMNTADRSIALLDKALRRRFGFVECMPDADVLNSTVLHGVPLAAWLRALNERIRQKVGRDARNLQIGHSYLMEGERPLSDFGRFGQVLQDEILPLIEEYCYEDYSALCEILGPGLVDTARQVIKAELFEDARRDELVQALLEPFPDIASSRQAVLSEAAKSSGENEEDAVAAAEAE